MRLRSNLLVPLMLSFSLFALTGCDALFTAPSPGGEKSGKQDQETPDLTDPAKPTTTYMYVMNGMSKTIDEINLKTLELTPNVMETGEWPNQLLTQGVITYMVNSGDNNIFKLDLRARKKLDTINLPEGANPMTVTLLGSGMAMINNLIPSSLTFLNLATHQTDAEVKLPGQGAPSFVPGVVNNKAYVPVDKWEKGKVIYSAIHVVDLATKQVLKTLALPLDANPGDVAVDPSGKVWVGVKSGLLKIDPSTDTIAQEIPLDAQANAVQFLSATKGYASVAGGLISFNPSTGAVLRGVSDKIEADNSWGAFKIFQGVGYVTDSLKNTVTIIDLVTEAASGSPIPVAGDHAQDLTFVTVED